MSFIEPFSRLIGVKPDLLSPEETILLELDLYIRIRDQLQEFFKEQFPDYFITTNVNSEKENTMFEGELLRLIVRDIISSGDYTLEGLARYTNTHEEVIEDVLLGKNDYPSSILFHKTVELHLSIRREMYESIIKKIISQYLMIAEMPTTIH